MKVTNIEVYDLGQSMFASGYPMQTEIITGGDADQWEATVCRATRLAVRPANSGHANFLKGILVSMDVSGTIKWWEQAQRYHFLTIVSSQSTMHRITQMDPDKCTSDKVLGSTRRYMRQLIARHVNGDIDFDTLIDNMPLGIVLTARVTTNYLQLRTIYNQRKYHKYHEWRPFIEAIRELPYSKEFITIDGATV